MSFQKSAILVSVIVIAILSIQNSSNLLGEQKLLPEKTVAHDEPKRAPIDRSKAPVVTKANCPDKNTLNTTTSVAICSIMKNEEAYVDEWVDYHRALGYEHFYIYDNSDSFEMRQWALEKSCHVSVKHWPGLGQQHAVYQDCLRAFVKKRHTWVHFMDSDEFLVLKQHNNVTDMLQKYCTHGALAVNWIMFGTSGRLTYEPLPVTKRFQYREETVNRHVKVIVKVSDLKGGVTAHVASTTHGTKDSNGKKVSGPFNPNGPSDVVLLYHYHPKSFKEYIAKRVRGRVSVVDQKGKGQYDKLVKNAQAGKAPNGTVFDDTAWQFLKKQVPWYAKFDEIMA